MAIEFAERTDPGRDPNKQINEDASGYKQTPLGHLSVVCDGMGGHEGGREASTLALRTIFEVFDRVQNAESVASPGLLLREAIEEANRRVFAMPEAAGVQEAGRPGATVVAILHHENGTEVAHVGDSRAYLIHGSDVTQLTRDHSIVQAMVDAKMLTPEQAIRHPDANKISRALGMKADVDVEVRPQPVPHVTGDVFVLCSDGLSDLVGPSEILRIAGGAPAQQAAGQLVDLANARGGHDNITVQILRAGTSAIVRTTAIMPTVVDTQPPPPVAPASAPMPSIPQPPSVPRRPATTTEGPSGTHHRSPIVIVGLLLALAGLVLAGIAVYTVVARPTRHAPFLVDTADARAHDAPDAQLLESIDAATSSEPTDAEVPSIPALDPSGPHRRRLPRDH